MVQGEQYVLHLQLVEVEIFIKIKVSDRCSDVQNLFWVIGYDGETLCSKNVTISGRRKIWRIGHPACNTTAIHCSAFLFIYFLQLIVNLLSVETEKTTNKDGAFSRPYEKVMAL
jgi:hypothetical protein